MPTRSVLLAAALVILAAAVIYVSPSIGGRGALTAQGTTHLTNLSITGDLAVGDDLTVTDDATIAGDLTAAGFLVEASATITPTDGGVITPTAGLVYVTGLSAYTGSALGYCGSTSGRRLTIVNSINQSLVLTETGGLVSAGNITLGQWDSATFVCANNTWIQTATSNN